MRGTLLAWPGAPLALVSAALFGANTPFAKLLLGEGISPWLLAGLLYLGSGIGLSIVHLGRRVIGLGSADAPLRRADLPWLALVVLSGGVLGPALLMIGLTTTPASSTALLLNLESLATMVIAWVAFRENVDRRLLVGAAAILGGAVLLSWQGGPRGFGPGAIAVVGACVAWGIDNNLTRKAERRRSGPDCAHQGSAAGTMNFVLATDTGATSTLGPASWRAAARARAPATALACPVCAGPSPSGSGEDGRIFLDCPVHRRGYGDINVRGKVSRPGCSVRGR